MKNKGRETSVPPEGRDPVDTRDVKLGLRKTDRKDGEIPLRPLYVLRRSEERGRRDRVPPETPRSLLESWSTKVLVLPLNKCPGIPSNCSVLLRESTDFLGPRG